MPVTQSDFNFKEELQRLCSFHNIPHFLPVSSILLAQGGFFYNGSGRMKCAFCHCELKVSSLDEGFDIIQLHKDLNPACPIISGNSCGYISTNANGERNSQTSLPRPDAEEPSASGLSINNQSLQEQQEQQEQQQQSHAELLLLEMENTLWMQKTHCKSCHQNQVNCLYLPCGHAVSCVDCGQNQSQCLKCHTPILDRIKTYFS